MDTDSADLVRSGYNAVSRRYRGDDDTTEQYDRWLADLLTRLPERGDVLDRSTTSPASCTTSPGGCAPGAGC